MATAARISSSMVRLPFMRGVSLKYLARARSIRGASSEYLVPSASIYPDSRHIFRFWMVIKNRRSRHYPLRYVDTIVIVPVGPGVRTDFLADTIESVRAYLGRSYFIVLLNDSGKAIAKGLLAFDEGIVFDTHGPNGGLGELFVCKCLGIKYAVERFRFRAILALDTDALIIGPSPDVDGIRYFEAHPNAAILGSFRKKLSWRSS